MKRVLLLLALITAVVPAVPAADSTRHVVILSLDGCKPSYLRDDYVPNLRELWKSGACSWNARTVSPSLTLVAHASMLTGLLPAKLGIDWNTYQPDRGEIRAPTVFDLAHKAGLQTVFVGSKRKLKHLDRPGTSDASAFPRNEIQETGTDPKNPYGEPLPMFDTVKAVRDCFGQSLPNLCFIHFSQPDLTAHKVGWESEEVLYKVRQLDQQIGALFAYWRKIGFLENTMVLVTADHGGHDRTHGTDDWQDMEIPWVAWGAHIKQGYEIQSPVNITDTAATAAFYLKLSVPKNWDGEVVTEIFQ